MNLKIITTTAMIVSVSWAFQISFNQLNSKPDGAPSGVTGSPGDGGNTCAKSGCHTGNAIKTKSGIITSNIPSTGYVPGTTYTITAKVKSPTVHRWGFEISPQNSVTGALMGQLIVTNTNQTKLVGSGKYITHTTAGNSGVGIKTWTFNWKAPNAGAGKVKFFGTFLYANNNGGTSGDTCYKSSLLKYEDTIPLIQDPNRFEVTNGLTTGESNLDMSVYPNPFSYTTTIQLSGNDEENYSYEVFSLSGERVKSEKNIPAANRIQLGDDLAPGIYFLRAVQGNQSKILKIVKAK